MATGRMAPDSDADETRQLVLGMLVGFILMVGTMLGAMWAMGAFPPGGATAVDVARQPIVISSDELDTADAKPTAVWRFRKEWLTPQPK